MTKFQVDVSLQYNKFPVIVTVLGATIK